MIYLFFIFTAAVLLLLLYMYRLANTNRLLVHHLDFPDFPSSMGTLSIFFISDVHKREIDDELLEQVKGKADLVIMGGDLAEAGVSFERIEKNLAKLQKVGPVYFVWGNNDYELDYHQLDALMLRMGIKILDNTSIVLESASGEKISLMGVDYYDGGRARLDLAIQDSLEGTFRILASHSPGIMEKVKDDQRISLVLSGHTHGGQIRIFGLGQYELGKLSKKGNTKLLVSNGYGTSAIPMRLGAKPETHLIHLKRSDESGPAGKRPKSNE